MKIEIELTIEHEDILLLLGLMPRGAKMVCRIPGVMGQPDMPPIIQRVLALMRSAANADAKRIAELEGEVERLREIEAALTGTRTQEFDADNPERLKARLNSQGIEIDRLREIEAACKMFIADNGISCAEFAHQMDCVSENSPHFIVKLCELVGYVTEADVPEVAP